MKAELESGEILKTIKESGGELLEKAELFDVYRGAPIPPGFKSMAYSLRYRDPSKTLTDEEITGPHEAILKALQKKFNAKLREM